ncbi:MAG: mevalonate kinase [Nitrososphaera sp.]|jgi:mevalonate kinase
MKSIASAPGKVILFGEHFVVYGTKAILCSIDKRITASSQFINEKKAIVKTVLGNKEIRLDELGNLDSISPKFLKPFFYIAYDVLRRNSHDKGIELILESEIPHGVGLGSSSAACVAATASVNGLFKKLSKNEILKKSIEAEKTIFKHTSGADSAVSVFGGFLTYDTTSGFQELSFKNNFDLIIANSAQIHNTQGIVNQVKKFKEKNENLFNELCAKEDEIIKNALHAFTENNLEKMGMLMSENQKLLEQIGVSTEKIRTLINEATKTAYGSKLTGAGGGGCIISLVDKNNTESTLANLRKLADCFVAKVDYDGMIYM